MTIESKTINPAKFNGHLVVLADRKFAEWQRLGIDKCEVGAILKENNDSHVVVSILTRLGKNIYLVIGDGKATINDYHKAGAKVQQDAAERHNKNVGIIAAETDEKMCYAFVEGLVLNDYAFDKYKTKKAQHVERLTIDKKSVKLTNLDASTALWRRIDQCRDWVNEPVINLNAPTFAGELKAAAKEAGVRCTVLGQKQIESLKMGGLLAVNRGSVDEARLVVLEYKAAKCKNKKPIVLVGKGIMYDTGGLNIKPDEYMREMKSDMAGAATMASVLFVAADRQLPLHIVAILPLTDNRPGFNAYAADDIITMHSGTTVEVVNTDAEGRLILADALSYARQYDPSLVIDAATLTGAAVRAIGTFGIAMMQKDADKAAQKMENCGNDVYERLVELPMWDEYDELIKSDVADIKNCGTAQAGCITAAKFLEHFTDYPYIHLDIAGVAFFDKRVPMYGIGASGYGIRLLTEFLERE